MERIGDVLERWLAGAVWIGLCRVCWCRQPVSVGIRCRECGGVIARVRVG